MSHSVHTVSDYLMDRLAEWGVDRVFGVPGDYTLGLLDHVVEHPAVTWTGCTNELNAGYAADGYARLRGGAALLTTFGVGELSAINAVAGSYAEHVPVLHIVGSPTLDSQAAHRIVHHSLGNGVFTQFLEMHRQITCARASLTVDNAASEIDRVLAAVRDERLPGYLLIPADVAAAPLDGPRTPLPSPGDLTDPEALSAFVDAARDLFGSASDSSEVAVLAGLFAHRLGAGAELSALLEAGQLAHATSLWGKSVVDESSPRFAGIYAGAASTEAVRSTVEDAPVLITAGVQFTDLNSGFFTQVITRERTIEIGPRSASVGATVFSPVALPRALSSLLPLVEELDRPGDPLVSCEEADLAGGSPEADAALTQGDLWAGVAGFLRSGDIVVADQGCSFYGAATHRLPTDVVFIGQPLWASIGYTLPALIGACLAEPGRRGVLLIGDGAAQMTVQELSTLFRLEIAAVVVVLDNDGYTVERAIHGPDQPYNDIARWDWTSAGAFLAPDRRPLTARVTTNGELRAALEQADEDRSRQVVIQAVTDRMDVPELLTELARSAGEANARKG
jgi:alpha-keto-acid decarboxylase